MRASFIGDPEKASRPSDHLDYSGGYQQDGLEIHEALSLVEKSEMAESGSFSK